MKAGWRKRTTGNWGQPEGPWEKSQAKRALRKKGLVRRRNAFWVVMRIKGGFKLLERVTRGELTLWKEGKKNQWKADAKRQLTFSLEMDGYTSCHRLRNAHIPKQAGGRILRSSFSSFGLICLDSSITGVSSSLGKCDCFSEPLISFTVSKPSLYSTLEFRTHRMLILKWLFKNKNRNTKSLYFPDSLFSWSRNKSA